MLRTNSKFPEFWISFHSNPVSVSVHTTQPSPLELHRINIPIKCTHEEVQQIAKHFRMYNREVAGKLFRKERTLAKMLDRWIESFDLED
jgi:hypothetical protein